MSLFLLLVCRGLCGMMCLFVGCCKVEWVVFYGGGCCLLIVWGYGVIEYFISLLCSWEIVMFKFVFVFVVVFGLVVVVVCYFGC